MQVPVFTICYTAANGSNPAGRIATGFPLPSTGRGIEGEGWSYPEPPPVRFFLYQHHPASKLNTSPENPRINTFITMNERLQTRVARATGPYRPATRRTERVRRSFGQRTPFVIGASSFFRHSTFVIRHSQTETFSKPRNNTFITMKNPVHNYPKHHRHPMVSPPFHPGGIPACSRWLSEAIPPESNPAASRTPAGVPAIDLTARESFAGSHPSTDLFHAHSWAKTPEITHYASACFYNMLRSQPKRQRLPAASLLASLSPQRGEGLRVRGGHIQNRLPREPPVVDEVALRLRLPAEQALCGVASPGACA